MKNFTANPNSKSVTREIATIELPKEMYSQFFNNKLYLLDTPGFEDTEGSTMNLSNCYGIV